MLAVRVLIGILCVVWLVQAAVFVVHIRNMRTLARVTPKKPRSWPRVSVIVPARDEATAIGSAVRSRLVDDYPDLEIIIVDDRSTDGTGDVARGIAAEDSRVRVVRVDGLPEGWLGKVHALQRGLDESTGEWILFSDADVHVEPGTMRQAIAYCLDEGFDHLALIPEFETGTFLVDVLWTVFLRIFGVMIDFAAVRDPKKRTAMGSGSFNLVRRAAWDKTEGFEWLRLETSDDMSLGLMMKRAGLRAEAADGRGAAKVLIYSDLRAFYRGTEKNAGAILGPPLPLFLLGALAWLALEWSPLIALASGPLWLRALGGLALVAATAIHVASLRINTGRSAAAFAWPLGSLLFAVALVRSRWLAYRRGGVVWRGTLYANEEILANRRFELT